MTLFWVIAFVLFLVLETQTLEFTLLSIALGCLLAAGVSAAGVPLLFQVILATVGSVGSLVLLAPVLRRRFTPRDTATGVDTIVGSEAEVVEAIQPPAQGKVKLNGVVWQAVASHAIPAGARVVVTELSGARLTVVGPDQLLTPASTQAAAPPVADAPPRPEPQQDLSH